MTIEDLRTRFPHVKISGIIVEGTLQPKIEVIYPDNKTYMYKIDYSNIDNWIYYIEEDILKYIKEMRIKKLKRIS